MGRTEAENSGRLGRKTRSDLNLYSPGGKGCGGVPRFRGAFTLPFGRWVVTWLELPDTTSGVVGAGHLFIFRARGLPRGVGSRAHSRKNET